MFRVALDLGGICLRRPLSLSVSQLLNEVANLMWWAFLCSTRLPPAVLLLYRTGLPLAVLLLYKTGLPPTVLGLSVLSKGVEISPTRTQLSPTCVRTSARSMLTTDKAILKESQ